MFWMSFGELRKQGGFADTFFALNDDQLSTFLKYPINCV
jgi:hypothetical protein